MAKHGESPGRNLAQAGVRRSDGSLRAIHLSRYRAGFVRGYQKALLDHGITPDDDNGFLATAEMSNNIRLATYEECARIAEHLNGWGFPMAPDLAHHIAKVIREQCAALLPKDGT